MKPVKNLDKLNKVEITLFNSTPFRFEITNPNGPAYDTQIWLSPVHTDCSFRNYVSMNINWENNHMDVMVRYKKTYHFVKGFGIQSVRINANCFRTIDAFIDWVKIVIPAVPNLEKALMAEGEL